MRTLKNSLFTFICVFLFGCQIDDNTSPTPGDTFIKYFGDTGLQSAIGMLYLDAADEIVIYGVRENTSSANQDFYLLRVDANGNELNSEVIDFASGNESFDTGAGDDVPGSLKYDASLDQFLYVGTSSRSDTINQTGNFSILTWAVINQDFSVENNGEILLFDVDANNDTIFRDVTGNDVILQEASIIRVVGSTNQLQAGDVTVPVENDENQVFTARIDITTGDVLRSRSIGFVGDDVGFYVDQFGNDDIVIIGTTERETEEGRNVYILPITNNGSPLDGTVVSFPINGDLSWNEAVLDVYKRPNGYVITGLSTRAGEQFPYFVNVNYTGGGNAVVSQAVPVAIPDESSAESTGTLNGFASSVVLGANGNYYLAGTIPQFPDKEGEIMILQTNQLGVVAEGSLRNYGLTSGNDRANDIMNLPDGSLLILSTVEFGGNDTLIGLMKVNQSGDLME